MGWLVFNSRYFQNAGIHKVEGVQIHRKFLGAQEGQSVSQSLTHTFRFPLCRCLCTFTTQRSRDVIFFESYYQQVSDFDCDVYFPKCFLFWSKHPLWLLPSNRKGKDCGNCFTQLDTAVGYWILLDTGYRSYILPLYTGYCRSLLRSHLHSLLQPPANWMLLTFAFTVVDIRPDKG